MNKIYRLLVKDDKRDIDLEEYAKARCLVPILSIEVGW
jgi:hypothetical protein